MGERMFVPNSSDEKGLDVAPFTDILASLQCYTKVGMH